MKAFLMHKSEDFDLQRQLPWNERALIEDLGLTILFDAMADGDDCLFKVANTAVLSSLTDPSTILYRQSVLRDCLKHESTVRALYQLAVEAIENEKKSYWGWFTPRYPGGILHRGLEALHAFIGMLKGLRQFADQHGAKFESDAFVTLFAALRT